MSEQIVTESHIACAKAVTPDIGHPSLSYDYQVMQCAKIIAAHFPAEREKVNERLLQYAAHMPSCSSVISSGLCDCGYAKLKAELSREAQFNISKCSVCGSQRIWEEDRLRFGACGLIGCKDPLFDFRKEHPEIHIAIQESQQCHDPFKSRAECVAEGTAQTTHMMEADRLRKENVVLRKLLSKSFSLYPADNEKLLAEAIEQGLRNI
jgi:hypothetical protein